MNVSWLEHLPQLLRGHLNARPASQPRSRAGPLVLPLAGGDPESPATGVLGAELAHAQVISGSVRTGSASGRPAPPPRPRWPNSARCGTRSTVVVLATVH